MRAASWLLLLSLTAPALADDAGVRFSPHQDAEAFLVEALGSAAASLQVRVGRLDAASNFGAQDFDEVKTPCDVLREAARRGLKVRLELGVASSEAASRLSASGVLVTAAEREGGVAVIDGARWVLTSSDWTDALRRHHGHVVVLASEPRRVDPLLALRAAKREVLLASSGAPSGEALAALCAAAARGVVVRALFDQRLDDVALPGARYLTYSLRHHPPLAKTLDQTFMVVDREAVLLGPREVRAPKVVDAFAAEHARLYGSRRGEVERVLARLGARRGTRDYRRYVPCHFAPLALDADQRARLVATARRIGALDAPARGAPPWTSWHFDRQERAGTNRRPKTALPFLGERTR